MDPKASVRRLSPTAYRMAVRARRSEALSRVSRAPKRRRARRIFEHGGPVTLEVTTPMGIGGILNHAGQALHRARQSDVRLALAFRSPTYAPTGSRLADHASTAQFEGGSSGDASGDWLDRYFDRLGPVPGDSPVVDSRDCPPADRPLALGEMAGLVWEAVRIRSDYETEAGALAGEGTFAAVHFRGSDKFLEAPRAAEQSVLDTAEREMRIEGLQRVFIATDEVQFLEKAEERFGPAAFSLPLEAVSTADGKAPHFTEVKGETKAREALVTMLVLSKARLLVKTESFFSDWASTLASGQRVVEIQAPGR